MALEIVEDYIDPAGFRRVRVQHDGTGESKLFKFAPGMTVAAMKAEAQAAFDAEVARRQAEAAERVLVRQISNGVEQFLNGELTNPQQLTLLNALASEWRKRDD